MREELESDMNGSFRLETTEYFYNKCNFGNKIVALTRIRNEGVILLDFLDHLGEFSDGIIVYDDSSTDDSVEICRSHKKVLCIIRNNLWSHKDRTSLETKHRAKLLSIATEKFSFEWFLYLDADERLVGDVRHEICKLNPQEVHYFRIPLYDAYLTEDDNGAFSKSTKLLNSRRFYGPERRDIIFGWNLNASPKYELDDSREPSVTGNSFVTILGCQHFGKAISIDKWDSKCHYYINNFPYEPYGRKWKQRLGKAIHKRSDFDTTLYEWGEELFKNAILIHPIS